MKHTESKTQQACVRWFRYTYPNLMIFSIPNGAVLSGNKMQRIKQWKRLEAEGAMPGVPDLFIPVKSIGTIERQYSGLFIEMKSEDGRLSVDQKNIGSKLFDLGYQVKVCRSLDEFIQVVNNYLLSE